MFDEYKVYDGPHPIAIEAESAKKDLGEDSLLVRMWDSATQTIYKFPNGYGASVVHGHDLFRPDLWEVMTLTDFRDGPGVKPYSFVEEPFKTLSYGDILEKLSEIFNMKARRM